MALIRKLPLDFGIQFIARRSLFLAFSAFLLLGSVGLFLVQGLNFGVDFRGGILLEVRTQGPADLGALRDRFAGLDLGEVSLQQFGEPTDVLINIRRQEGDEKAQLAAVQVARDALGDSVEIRRQEFVGPKVGDELKRAGLLATVLALAGIGLYIWFRFEWYFSVAALIALIHDVVATVGFYSLTQIEFNLATLAAVLTIAGYSINDTVVIFDRVRETLRRYKKLPVNEVLNRAINLTLSRTILTSVTTLLALGALFFFGGEVIRGFTAGLIWGVVIGTYSSVALAVPILTFMTLRRGGEEDDPTEAKAKGKAAEAS
ncbi:protein translocase subunit SecF [Pelagibius sp.]|uniref:protein translocase subunit SecF n=1 Tax=Pelagibius sp. TaxID=1931238 RepID=UPI002626D112|nr:protein translocase subunit SecF [Pelagibius sp.]